MTVTANLDLWRRRANNAETEADTLIQTNAHLDALLSLVVHRYGNTIPGTLRTEIAGALTRARQAEADHQANLRTRST